MTQDSFQGFCSEKGMQILYVLEVGAGETRVLMLKYSTFLGDSQSF